MADLPRLQEGAARAEIQAAGMADQRDRFLVPSLPLSLEYLHYL
jgi:hypothetical protein